MKTEMIERLTAKLVEEGKHVEAGWHSYLIDVVPPDSSPEQIENMRLTFYAGATHLFETLLLDADDEASGDDLDKLDDVEKELAAFRASLVAQLKTAGNA